ncbi:MAG: 23S rRNA (guanosine(2251)-2'-O)-methyltransferase RlmB [Nitrospirae bacterium GWD2_57_9]|nr:MAG: 23S rRNA (guanosine(2251)-2'-O)-methyltransferase RlmB [Nitrospirae bacterium GWD2_57_9]OGW47427.1 MAG: 23S rRNA (guanosine(2251)-2'-O)-methyltransferase RlmB [Nitrospirae bacterium GWC2_57_9]
MQTEKIIGINPVIEALRSGRPIQRILIAEQRRSDRDTAEIIRLARSRGIEVRMTGRDALSREAPQGVHQGVVAFAAAHAYSSLDDILKIPAERGETPLFLILDGVEDPRNLGAILRTAEAAGVHGVIIPERRSAGLNETVAKAAAGALEYVSVVKVINIVNTIEELKKNGVWVAAAEAGGDMQYWDADFVRPTVLVLGGEDKGVRRLVREHCDYTLSLPLMGRISSLNVSVAAGIMLYEVLRQRKKKK